MIYVKFAPPLAAPTRTPSVSGLFPLNMTFISFHKLKLYTVCSAHTHFGKSVTGCCNKKGQPVIPQKVPSKLLTCNYATTTTSTTRTTIWVQRRRKTRRAIAKRKCNYFWEMLSCWWSRKWVCVCEFAGKLENVFVKIEARYGMLQYCYCRRETLPYCFSCDENIENTCQKHVTP